MAAGLARRGFLDGRECWKKWHTELFSLGKVQDHFIRQEVLNPKTGAPPTKSGIEKSAFGWALDNLEEARKDLEFAWSREGATLTDEEWNVQVVKFARLYFYNRKPKYREYIIRNGLQRYAEQ